jgi:hypothetical protein
MLIEAGMGPGREVQPLPERLLRNEKAADV